MAFSFSGLVSTLGSIGKDAQSVSSALGEIGGIVRQTDSQFAANSAVAQNQAGFAEGAGVALARGVSASRDLWVIAGIAAAVVLVIVLVRR